MNLESFLADCASTVYAEPESELHTQLTHKMWAWCRERMGQAENLYVLDFGCGGSGVSIEMFRKDGHRVKAITGSDKEASSLRGKFAHDDGCRIFVAEMHGNLTSLQYDFIWARHVLEHSPVPLYVLEKLRRFLGPGGHLYIEVPSPDTPSSHEINPNHYSVLGKRMWESLIERAGFSINDRVTIEFETPLGKDQYFAWLCQKKG